MKIFMTGCPWVLVFVSACGNQGPEHLQKAIHDEPASSQPVISSESKTPQVSAVETLIEPKSFGGAWSRSIKLSAPQVNRVIVEVRSSIKDAWQLLGLTDESGVVVDGFVGVPRQYRLGAVFVSPVLPAVSDAFFDVAVASVKSFRVIVRGQHLLGDKAYSIDTSRLVFEDSGRLSSFEEGSVGSASSGSVAIRADQILGRPCINLSGQPGAAGPRGQDGKKGRDGRANEAGQNGTNGQDGGDGAGGGHGGTLFVEILSPNTLNQSCLSYSGAPGGAGGVGGQGGPGGRGGEKWAGGLARHGVDPERLGDMPDGQRGSPGRDGSPGPHGQPGRFFLKQLQVPNGFDRYIGSYSSKLELTDLRTNE